MQRTNKKTVTVLVVEDDDVDMLSLQRAFRKCGISNPLLRAIDGVEALAMLRGEQQHPSVPKPYCILLDINMPRMNGFEFRLGCNGFFLNHTINRVQGNKGSQIGRGFRRYLPYPEQDKRDQYTGMNPERQCPGTKGHHISFFCLLHTPRLPSVPHQSVSQSLLQRIDLQKEDYTLQSHLH